jgi:predicted permease
VKALRVALSRALGVLTRRRRERDFDDELRSHVDLHVEDGIRAGLAPEEARRRALVMLGGLQQARETYRDRVGIPSLEILLQDLRFAIRLLAKAPGFTAVAVFVLALGIGANAAVFSLINAVLLRPLNGTTQGTPMGVYIGDRARPDAWRFSSYLDYTELRRRTDLFSALVAETSAHPGLEEDGRTQRISARLVSSNYFSGLGAAMEKGRGFTATEENPDSASAVAVVSYPFWRRHGFDPAMLGRTLRLNGRPFTIVGIAPERFTGVMPMASPDMWLPLGATTLLSPGPGAGVGPVASPRTTQSLIVTAFLRDGLTPDEANRRLVSLAASMVPAAVNGQAQLVVAPRSRTAIGIAPRRDTGAAEAAALAMLLTTVVLIVACLNLANMLLARGSARRPEIAVRLALGGSRGRIVRQLFTEGLLLSLLGGAAALMLAWLSSHQVAAALEGVAGRNVAIDLRPDIRVLAAVAIACVISSVAFSLGPAWTLSKPDLVTGLKTSGLRGRRQRFPVPDVLVGAQIALSLALLVAAALFTRAGVAASNADPGYSLDDGLLVHTDLDIIRVSPEEGRRLYGRLADRLRNLPGVQAASLASIVPFGSYRDGRLTSHDKTLIFATYTVVGSDYVKTLGLKLLAGREFTRLEEQSPAASPVALVDQALVDQLFPGRNPIGQVLHMSTRPDRADDEAVEIVGVVPAVRDDLVGGATAHVYVPFGARYRGDMTLRVKTEPGAEAALVLPIREAIAGVDRRVPLLSMQTLTEHRDASETVMGLTIAAAVFGALGLIALFLASIGVYGLRAYLVAQRTREFGIRVALGATRGSMVRQVLREGARVAAIGMAVGGVLAAALTAVLQQSGMVLDVSAGDPLVAIGAPLVLLAATALASYIPARRAMNVEPTTALRVE